MLDIFRQSLKRKVYTKKVGFDFKVALGQVCFFQQKPQSKFEAFSDVINEKLFDFFLALEI